MRLLQLPCGLRCRLHLLLLSVAAVAQRRRARAAPLFKKQTKNQTIIFQKANEKSNHNFSKSKRKIKP
ncbi:hypothetical protein [Methanimicrococcus stummii]|uniref:hypothetical protein n=1 Tax=Methanimicrococcus stummii TaxID=3028294 RepID=UPI00292EB788|nr:hypothetical protein [Methanimicrococcus sp. Es2]